MPGRKEGRKEEQSAVRMQFCVAKEQSCQPIAWACDYGVPELMLGCRAQARVLHFVKNA